MNNYYNKFNEDQFLHIHNFFNKYTCDSLIKTINLIEKNKLSKISNKLNNHTVLNKHRYQVLLYVEKYVVNDLSNKNMVDYYFNNIYKLLYPTIISPIINFFNHLNINNIKLLRISIVYVCPNAPNQEIHHDSNIDDGHYYTTIPLHDTPMEMGPTVLFSYKNTKKYHNHFKINKLKNTNNIGFYNNIKNDKHLKESKIQNEHLLGDLLIWNNKTFHYGSENKSNSIRKYLFFIWTIDKYNTWNLRLNINNGIDILNFIEN
jgi:ectoine hydroxylase-related dioxygenase (phytanoyl-CoA dioxygenase family)